MSMRKFGLTLLGLFISMPVFAQGDIDSKINEAIEPFANAVAGFIFSSFPVAGVAIPFVLVWLIAGAIFFTFYFWIKI